jgi:hypothetical protein
VTGRPRGRRGYLSGRGGRPQKPLGGPQEAPDAPEDDARHRDPGPTWETPSGGYERSSGGGPADPGVPPEGPAPRYKVAGLPEEAVPGEPVHEGRAPGEVVEVDTGRGEPSRRFGIRAGRLGPGGVTSGDDGISRRAREFLASSDRELDELRGADPEGGEADPRLPPPAWHELADLGPDELEAEVRRMEGQG